VINYITLILGCQLAGELFVTWTGLPVPGPVVGMALSFTGLLVKGSIPTDLATTADAFLENLSLLFIPAGVGVMLHMDRLGREWLPITIALVVSTLLTIAVTGVLMSKLAKRSLDSAAAPDGEGG
jgi:putative effector of murein hydrolase LrgA (UPF0299 family)